MCGAVRLVGTGRPKWVAWSHCQSCRRHSGAPVSVFAAFARAAHVVTKGEITKLGSLPGVQRGFCARCGSNLTCESERLRRKQIFPSVPSIWRHGTGRGGTYSRRSACLAAPGRLLKSAGLVSCKDRRKLTHLWS